MDSTEQKQWLELVERALENIDDLDEHQIQSNMEIAQGIRIQLGQLNKSSWVVALMMMQLEDIENGLKDEFDPAFA
tara:strand:- start:168 stop:395 length:228 start_codon:yes stop_codon:yes gene_type:complete